MKIKARLSEVFYTIDTYQTFDPDHWLRDGNDEIMEGDFNHEEYVEDLGRLHAETINGAILGNLVDGPVQAVKFVSASSPKYYNYATDQAVVEITIDKDKLCAYTRDNALAFNEFLERNFTSYDGFWSFVPNNLKEFQDEWDKESHLGIMAGWYLTREVLNSEEYLQSMFEDVSEIVFNNIEESNNDRN